MWIISAEAIAILCRTVMSVGHEVSEMLLTGASSSDVVTSLHRPVLSSSLLDEKTFQKSRRGYIRHWTVSSWFGLVRRWSVRHWNKYGVVICWINSRLPFFLVVSHVHYGRYALTENLQTNLRRTRLYLVVQTHEYVSEEHKREGIILHSRSPIPSPLIAQLKAKFDIRKLYNAHQCTIWISFNVKTRSSFKSVRAYRCITKRIHNNDAVTILHVVSVL